ncbi:FAD-dependent oxidoreductase [Serpentinicella sp. ANB-PHB4]|uniref:NAD(P)/FAD-dependent oxidoreductase n=1 Tax=Serpentinicella sp. ANB-PHB4 TaxID=3074076 RepID=UPI002866596E|nr:FAD-dependent oxidoreductase [Serpentinicella sp. ANB-PHB4]MDR5659612.1 FAD-dependent oxidoreductase [Serpentinicella sp. ANB-PHB4]
MDNNYKYVIVGNGIAGLTAAQEIRKRDEESKILMVTNENYLTYFRVKLSHNISKSFDVKGLLMYKDQWYEEKRIKVVLNEKVAELNIEQKYIVIKGKKVRYEKLLLATGAKAFIPPIEGRDKTGVFSLRTISDLSQIQSYFVNCDNITVIGGGLLGLEAAWAIKELGKEVNVVQQGPFLLPRQLDEQFAKVVGEMLQDRGINFYYNAETKEVLGNHKVTGLLFEDGRKLETGAVLISAGVKPNIELAKSCNISCNKGIKVDRYLKTSNKEIYAAGDIAEVHGMNLGLWPLAQEQGKIAGANMTGANLAYSISQPSTLLTLGDIKVFSIGNINEFEVSLVSENKGNYYKLFLNNFKIVGGILIGDTTKAVKLKKAVMNKVDVSLLHEKKMSCHEIVETL